MPLFEKNGNRNHDLIANLANMAQTYDEAININVNEENIYVSQATRLPSVPGFMGHLQLLRSTLPDVMQPLSISFDPAARTQLSMYVGGFEVPMSGPDPLRQTIDDLEFISAITQDLPSEESETYVVGHAGKMNANKRLATISTDKPVEMALKVMAAMAPGIAQNPEAVMHHDIHAYGEIEVRTSHDWAKVDIDDLVAIARDEISLSIADDTPDISM
ncbi:MAG: hypothetical protein ABJN42_00040 [Roseibium sp.]|uniref:hypothetical protein n=1 Tax=Roseibium sp. TaxID=1936156 RepID=UPI0032971F10